MDKPDLEYMRAEHTHVEYMQAAVDIVNTSPHPANKVACTLVAMDTRGKAFSLSKTNTYPAPLLHAFDKDVRIGSSSATIHAEMNCILNAPKTKHARVYVTDPPCPNCMKYMAEAGIKELYIDHKGFYKDFALRRGDDFEHMSLQICKRAGIAVYEVWRKEQKIAPIIDVPKTYRPPLEHPALAQDIDEPLTRALFEDHIEIYTDTFGKHPFALCMAHDDTGQNGMGQAYLLVANIHAVIGYTQENLHTETSQDKYSFLLQPLNRLLVNAARKGLKISPDYIYSSRVPTSREFVNFIGAGFTRITIGDKQKSRDEHGIKALEKLSSAGILNVNQ